MADSTERRSARATQRGGSKFETLAALHERNARAMAEFRFDAPTLAARRAAWRKRDWPLELLERNHYGAKVLDDSGVLAQVRHSCFSANRTKRVSKLL